VNCESILERIAQGGADDAAVVAHLEVCPNCRLRMASAEKLGEYLRDPLFWETPDPRLRERVVEGVAREKHQPRPGRRNWWWLGVAAVVVITVGVAALLQRGPDWVEELEPMPAAPQASARVSGWNMDYGTKRMIEVAGLDPTGPNAYYEIWLTAPDGRHVSAGTFRMSGRFEVMAGVRRSEFPRIWITLEPADDDPAPNPQTVLDTPAA